MRTLVRLALAPLVLVTSIGSASSASSPQPKIEAIRAQLFYETSGVLSKNIAPPTKFEGWNTIIGEGDAKEPANDILVSVVLGVGIDEANVDGPLSIKVMDSKGKVLAERSFRNLYFDRHKSVRALFVPDGGCAGDIEIEAKIGSEVKRTSISLKCGE